MTEDRHTNILVHIMRYNRHRSRGDILDMIKKRETGSIKKDIKFAVKLSS